jgi:hypothetical protein
MVRTYWLVPVFNEASGNLDLQPFARIDHVEACRPRAMCLNCRPPELRQGKGPAGAGPFVPHESAGR